MAVTTKTRTCKKCGEEKPEDAFHRSKSHGGRHPWCAACKNARSAGYYKRWDDAQRDKHKIRVAAWRYGLSAEEYKALVLSVDAACAICGTHESSRGKLCVDHNHDTGEVRGVLCTECNAGIGMFKDNPILLARAIGYISGGVE